MTMVLNSNTKILLHNCLTELVEVHLCCYHWAPKTRIVRPKKRITNYQYVHFTKFLYKWFFSYLSCSRHGFYTYEDIHKATSWFILVSKFICLFLFHLIKSFALNWETAGNARTRKHVLSQVIYKAAFLPFT